jgi:hypothetical protein
LPAQRAGGDERLGITQRFPEDEQLVEGPVASGAGVGRGPCGERRFLEGEVGVNVDLGWSGRCCICLIATATVLELPPIASSHARTWCLCTGCNGSGQVTLLLVVRTGGLLRVG